MLISIYKILFLIIKIIIKIHVIYIRKKFVFLFCFIAYQPQGVI